jgi:hypothetical protein
MLLHPDFVACNDDVIMQPAGKRTPEHPLYFYG